MKREQLRRTLAFAIHEELLGHTRTLPNVRRYIVPKLYKYRINRSEKISDADIDIALKICDAVLYQKPIEFIFGRGDVWTERRKNAFMSADLPVE